MRLLFLGGFVARLEARLHADAERGVEGDVLGVATHLGAARRGLVDAQVLLALRLEGESAGVVGNGDDEEALFGGDGGRVGAEDAVSVAAEVSVWISNCMWGVW